MTPTQIGQAKRAAIYIRVSSEGQAKKRDAAGLEQAKTSPAAQEKDCRAYCTAHGYNVTGVYRDTERYRAGGRLVEPSGTRGDRPALRRMLADADAGGFAVLVAWREDRLYRAFRPMLDVLDCIERNGVTVELSNDSFDARFAPIKAWAARLELEAKRERVQMGMRGRLEKGKPGNNPAIYGYRRADDHYEIDPVEGPWVRRIWQWYAAGVPMREIRRRLITGGAPQRTATKHKWHRGVIQQLLGKQAYVTGATRYALAGDPYEIPLPVMIDAETAARVAARRERHQQYPAGNQKALALAAGKVYCRGCGVRMGVVTVQSRGKKFYYYRCQNNAAGLHAASCAGNVAMAALDAQIWGKVWKALSEQGDFEQALEARIAALQAEEVDAESECARLEGELDDLAMERQKVITQWRKGKMTDDDYDLQLGALTIEQAGKEAELGKMRLLVGDEAAKLLAIAAQYRQDARRGMAGLNEPPKTEAHARKLFETRRRYVDSLVTRADVGPDKVPAVKLVFDFSELCISEASGHGRWPRSRRAGGARC